jgi:hypothetical protein
MMNGGLGDERERTAVMIRKIMTETARMILLG